MDAAVAAIQRQIFVIRERQVMLDEDLAELYGVETGALTRSVRRNAERFPDDFMFQLTQGEFASLRSQTGISNGSRGGRRYRPYVFTEQGVAMLSGVLRSEHDKDLALIFQTLRQLVAPRKKSKRRVGFGLPEGEEGAE